MRETEKAPASVAALTGAVENGTACETAHAPTQDSTTLPAERQPLQIADLLHPGAENAVSRRDLMALTGYRDRALRLLIEAERRQGIPILSDNRHGYFLPATQTERKQCVASLRRRAKAIEETADSIEQGGDVGIDDGQLDFDDLALQQSLDD